MKWVSTDGSYTLKKEQETTKSKNTKTKNNKNKNLLLIFFSKNYIILLYVNK